MSRRYGLMADSVIVETNDEGVLAAADVSFGKFELRAGRGEPLRLRVFCEERLGTAPLVHRFDSHMYLIAGSDDTAAVNLAAGVGIAFIGSATSKDLRLVRYSFLEGMALSILTHSRGYFSIHAAGVARGGLGVALAGPEGAGKSTLALAAARRGLEVFAEDGVFVRAGPDGLEFWGLPWMHRLVLDARRFFPEFERLVPIRQPNGEIKVEIELDAVYPGLAKPSARPGAIVQIDRTSLGPTRITALGDSAPVEALWPWGDHWTEPHEAAARLLSELPVYRLTVNGTPDEAIDQLEALFEDLGSGQP